MKTLELSHKKVLKQRSINDFYYLPLMVFLWSNLDLLFFMLNKEIKKCGFKKEKIRTNKITYELKKNNREI